MTDERVNKVLDQRNRDRLPDDWRNHLLYDAECAAMSRFTLKWVDGQYKVSLPGIGTMDVVPAAELEEVLGVLKSLLDSIPSLTCDSFHHARKDQHDFDDECPPFERYLAAAIKARALIAKHGGGV